MSRRLTQVSSTTRRGRTHPWEEPGYTFSLRPVWPPGFVPMVEWNTHQQNIREQIARDVAQQREEQGTGWGQPLQNRSGKRTRSDAGGMRPGSYPSRVLDLLRIRREPMLITEVAAMLGTNNSTLRACLQDAVEREVLVITRMDGDPGTHKRIAIGPFARA